MQPDNPIVGGTDLRIPAIQSPNYVAGTSGWIVMADGSAEFNNVTVRGTFITGTVPGAHVTITGGQILVFDSSNNLVGQIDATGIQAIGTNGSKIALVPATTGNPAQAEVLVYPPTGATGVTSIAPADLLAFGQTPGSPKPILEIDSPGYNGNGQCTIFLQGVSADGTVADQITLQTSATHVTGDFSGDDATNRHAFDWGGQEVPRGGVGTIASGICTTAPAVTTVGGAEAAIPAATWASEPNFTFSDKHLYQVRLRFGTGIVAAGPTQMSGVVRLRKGSASTTGQILYAVTVDEFSNFVFVGREYNAYIKNVSGADITTKLSLTIARLGGATEWSLAGHAPGVTGTPCDVFLQDLGLAAGHPWSGNSVTIT